MEHSENTTVYTNRITWSDPEITILSISQSTLGGGATSSDATTTS